jgi:tetratricopeptide (TPR) repeat protein
MSEPERIVAGNQPAGRQTTAGWVAVLERPVFICLLLSLVTFAVYWPVIGCKFINYDDPRYITSNPHVQQGLTRESVLWSFNIGYASNWHPLSWLSHMLDVELFGPGPAGPHLVNLILHVANTVLLFLVLRGLTFAHWRSAFVAALFALHPLHVESVAWISERKDVLSTLFFMLTLLCYAKAVTSGRWQVARTQTEPSAIMSPFYWLALLFFALGLMSKPMLVTLPFVLLLLDYWPLGRMPDLTFPAAKPGFLNVQLSAVLRLAREKIPFFVLGAISCAITFVAQKSNGTMSSLAHIPAGARVENAFISYARYLGKMFWPTDLAVVYPLPGQWPVAYGVLAMVLVTGLCLAALWFGRKWPFVLTGWFWFLGTLVPVIGLVQVGIQSLADRYTYVPSVGIFIVLAWGGGAVLARWQWPRTMIGIAALLILGACAIRTANQLHYWQNTERLFQHTIAVTKDNWMAYNVLGSYRVLKGRPEAAVENYRHALQINPDNADILNNLGNVLARQKQTAAAIECFQAALRVAPDLPDTHINLGVVLDALGKKDDAIREYHDALRLAPDNVLARNDLANVLLARGQVDEAIEQYRLALQTDPKYTHALNNLGWVLAVRGQYPEAIACYERALRLEPNDAMLHKNFGNVLVRAGRGEEAIRQFTEALRLAPDDAEAHFDLGSVLAQLSRRDEAIAQLREALRLNPDYAEAKRQLEILGAAAR